MLLLVFFVGILAFTGWLAWPRGGNAQDDAQDVDEWDEDEGLPTGEGGAGVSGSHYQPAPPSDGRYSLEDTIYEMPPVLRGTAHPEHVLSGAAPEATDYDLRTVGEREADALAQMELRLDNALDALAYAVKRIDALERTVAAHADALTVINLREGL